MTGPGFGLLALQVGDLDRSRRFYEAVGVRFTREQRGAGPVHFAGTLANGVVLELHANPEGRPGGPTEPVRLGFTVDALSDVLSAASRLGAMVRDEPAATRWGRRCVVADPDGHLVELLQPEP